MSSFKMRRNQAHLLKGIREELDRATEQYSSCYSNCCDESSNCYEYNNQNYNSCVQREYDCEPEQKPCTPEPQPCTPEPEPCLPQPTPCVPEPEPCIPEPEPCIPEPELCPPCEPEPCIKEPVSSCYDNISKLACNAMNSYSNTPRSGSKYNSQRQSNNVSNRVSKQTKLCKRHSASYLKEEKSSENSFKTDDNYMQANSNYENPTICDYKLNCSSQDISLSRQVCQPCNKCIPNTTIEWKKCHKPTHKTVCEHVPIPTEKCVTIRTTKCVPRKKKIPIHKVVWEKKCTPCTKKVQKKILVPCTKTITIPSHRVETRCIEVPDNKIEWVCKKITEFEEVSDYEEIVCEEKIKVPTWKMEDRKVDVCEHEVNWVCNEVDCKKTVCVNKPVSKVYQTKIPVKKLVTTHKVLHAPVAQLPDCYRPDHIATKVACERESKPCERSGYESNRCSNRSRSKCRNGC